MKGPKVFIMDIEMAPIVASVWGLRTDYIGHNQIRRDPFMLSYAAKEWKKRTMFYEDLRHEKVVKTDAPILGGLWTLMDNADILVGHNFKSFDNKTAKARFILNGIPTPKKPRIIDTMLIAKKHFRLPSYSLEYLTSRLCPDFPKMKSRKFIGQELWDECERGNLAAWQEMEKYNRQDVLATEALWEVLEPYDNSINFNLYTDDPTSNDCKCGGLFRANGKGVKGNKIIQRYRCNKCGAEALTAINEIEKADRKLVLRAP